MDAEIRAVGTKILNSLGKLDRLDEGIGSGPQLRVRRG
jgi:hypothetical protein